MYQLSNQKRLKNQDATETHIFRCLCQHLGITNLTDGAQECKARKREAIQELPHAFGLLAADGYPVYYHSAITSWQGMNFELYKQLDRISMFGDVTQYTITTFYRALRYLVAVYCRAYRCADDVEREKIFRDALETLVASYPLYLGGRNSQLEGDKTTDIIL